MTKNIIEEYLEKRAIRKPWEVELPEKLSHLSQVIVVPAYDELEYLPKLLDSLAKNNHKICEETLVIVVVNNKEEGITPPEVINRNQETLAYLRKTQNSKEYPFHIGIIDASSKSFEIPPTSGVGLARKIGMDWGIKLLFNSGKENGGLICLDADCEVSENYLSEWKNFFEQNQNTSGIMAFAHPTDATEIGKAMMHYEIFLRLYELCLFYANSPYSYIPIGSTIGVGAKLYASVGGMNTKNAGEDFYFLQKVAKVAEIRKISSATVYPSARLSHRVVFGTGAKIKEYITFPEKMNLFYPFESFEILRKWIAILDAPKETPELMLKKASEIHPELMQFLIECHWLEKVTKIYKESKSKKQLSRRLHEWFDGLKTLRLLNYLRDKVFGYESIPVVGQMITEKIFNIEIDFSLTNKSQILNFLRERWKDIGGGGIRS
ncbi:MAG: glycosyltransferase family 2 protein [Candidatus Hydrogenedentes bacterium]|nr:glycosyltransferase family 2 protein [Candidatus Hydrogenedentota bacterium]